MKLGFCHVVLTFFWSGVAYRCLLYVQKFLHISFQMEVVELPDGMFRDVAGVVFPVDEHSLSIVERFYCRGGGRYQHSSALAL